MRNNMGDVHPVAEQGFCFGFELAEVEVATAVVRGDHQLGGVGGEMDRAPAAGSAKKPALCHSRRTPMAGNAAVGSQCTRERPEAMPED